MKKSTLKSGGFTMIELLVTMSIFLMLTGAVLANYRTFNTNALFANASEDVVLSLRQAQVYGASTKGHGAACPGSSFDCSYGVHFSTTDPHLIRIFVDVNGNRIYDAGEQFGEVVQWANNISVTGVKCGLITADCVGVMDVTFNRPNPDAYIADNVFLTYAPLPISGFDKGWIVLTDTNTGKTITTTITSAGQISIQ